MSAAPAPLRLLIDGAWVEGSGPVLHSVEPAHPGVVVGVGAPADVADVDRAVRAARRASGVGGATPMAERGKVLGRAADRLERDADHLGRELSREEGKPLAEGHGEVLRAAQILRYHGDAGDRDAGELYASPRAGERILVTRRPRGVVAVVTPFNFPIAIPAWKIAPALVHGNTVVWKPASTVPLLAQRLAEALDDAGLPAGVLNLVVGPGPLGARLATSDVDGYTFTGSTGVGRDLAVRLATAGVPFQAELGGKNASIVLDDADLELAVDQVVAGAFRGSGQRCTATSRLVVTSGVADEFLERLGTRIATLSLGDPLDPATDLGPLVDDRARDRVATVVGDARGTGIAEPGRHSGDAPREGYFVAPAVFELPEEESGVARVLWREELFGPVLAVRRARDADEAFALAGDGEFGLSAAVFTRDLGRALAAIDDLHVGVLHVNSESGGADPHVPFGGVGTSGRGPKEQGSAAREFFTETTTVYLRG